MSQTLYFIRHGETDWNAERRMQGQFESTLNDLGVSQATTNAETLKNLPVEALYASPLRRTRQTAEIIAGATGHEITFDDRLKEWSSGDWSGHLYDEIQVRWADEWAKWRADMWSYRPPGSENFEDLSVRGGAFLEEITASDTEHIAIVSHGFIGRAMIGVLLGLEPQEILDFSTPNGVFFKLTGEGQDWTIEHFSGGEGPFPGAFEGTATIRIA